MLFFIIVASKTAMCATLVQMSNNMCGTSTCSGNCFVDEDSSYSECVDSFDTDFCFNGRWTYFLLWLFFLIPTLLCVLISYWCLSYHPPNSVFILNLFTNSLEAILFNGIWCTSATSFYKGGNIVMTSVSGAFMLLIFVFGYFACSIACKDRRNWTSAISKCMQSDPIPVRYLMAGIKDIRQSPPIIQLHTEVHHEDIVRTVTPTAVKSPNFNRVLILPDETIAYGSWEEAAEEVALPERGSFLVDIYIEVQKTEGLKAKIQDKIDKIAEDGLSSGSITNSTVIEYVTDYIPRFVVSSEEPSCFQGFFRNWLGIYFYYFLGLIGYNSVVETIWCGATKRIIVRSIKRVSEKTEFRAKEGQRDTAAQTYERPPSYADPLRDHIERDE